MNYFYLDASAWVKRYHTESGSDLVNMLFQKTAGFQRIITSLWSLGETFAALNRTKNRFGIPEEDFNKIVFAFITDCENIHLLPLSDNQLFKSLSHVRNYNLNSADAFHLSAALELTDTLTSLGNKIVMCTADDRLIKASKSESVHVFNPETDNVSHLNRLI